ncbi:MAG: cohesin domain-containing protein [Anaerolineae bacterium]
MQNLKNYGTKVSFLLMLVLLTLLGTSTAWADTGARVYLQPVPAGNGLVAVEVMAENVTNLYGLELHLKYDPTVLEAQDGKSDQAGVQVEPGTLLPVSQGFVVANQADQAQGKVTYAITLLNPAPPVNGSGPIARLTFKTLQNIPSTINVEQAILVSASLQTIPVQTTPLTVGGAEQSQPVNIKAVTPAVNEDSFPWWLVAAVFLLLGLMAVGAVVIVKNTRKSALPTTPTSSRQPSTFK